MLGMRTLAIAIALLTSTTVLASGVPFSASDFAPYAENGSATLEGEAFLRTRGGGRSQILRRGDRLSGPWHFL